MSGTPVSRGDGEPKLERHVEAWRALVELNAAQVVERIRAGGDQFQDAVQAAGGSRNLERRSWVEPEAAEPRDERQEQRLVASLVGNVEKGVVRRVRLGDRSAPACCAPPRRAANRGAPAGVRLPSADPGALFA